MSEPTPLDQYLIEMINRARANPSGEAARLGIDFNQGLSQGKFSTAEAAAGLRFRFCRSARGHPKWMLDEDVFSHTGAGDSDPAGRIEAADYKLTGDWRWGENISWRGSLTTADNPVEWIETQNDALLMSPTHRENIFQGYYPGTL